METRSGWLLQASPRNGCNRSIPLTGMETAIFPSATMLTLILLQPINTPHGDGNSENLKLVSVGGGCDGLQPINTPHGDGNTSTILRDEHCSRFSVATGQYPSRGCSGSISLPAPTA